MFRTRRRRNSKEPDSGSNDPEPDLEKVSTVPAIEKKLTSIAASAFTPWPRRTLNDQLLGLYNLHPGPIRPGLRYMHDPDSDELCILDIDLGDKDLEGRGLGTLLIAAAVSDSLKRDPDLRLVSRDGGNLPFVKAVGKVVGLHNLRLEVDGTAFGVTPDLPAEAAWQNHPRSEAFPARNIRGIIDPLRMSGLDIPGQLDQLAETGRLGLWKQPGSPA